MILNISDRFRNRRVSYFNDATVNLKYDAVASTFQLSYYFDPENVDHKELSCVGHYHVCELIDNETGELILKGIVLSIAFDSQAEKTLVNISGYSLPGILEDCEIPPTDREGNRISLQSDNLSLREVAEKYVKIFGIGIVIHQIVKADMEIKYPQIEAKETESVKNFLATLCSQVDITMTHDRFGNLVFTREILQAPVYHFEKQRLPGVKLKLAFNGQGVHSLIWVLGQADFEGVNKAESEPLVNPYIPNQNNIFRPKVATQSKKSENAVDVDESARNIRAGETRNLSLTIEMDRWDFNGKIIRPGMTIAVTNPDVYLYRKTNFFIESVTLHESADKLKTATLQCCPPEAFTGTEPVYPFKGINLHPIE